MAVNRENGLTHVMTFACTHGSRAKKITVEGVKVRWFKMCPDCDLKVNWSPSLKAWLSEDDWKEYRNFGRVAAGLDPE